MNKLRHLFFLMLSLFAFIAAAADFKEGVEYKALKQPIPVISSSADKVEVDTVFWYGCPHCFDLAKLQEKWKKGKGEDVELDDVPVIFGKPWQAHAQLFYALEDMKLLDKAHFSVFEAVQEQGRRLDNEKDMTEFLNSRFGVKKEDFERAYGSFGVRNQTQKASAITRGAQLMGVPAIIVDGKYVVDPGMAGGLENMLKVADFLIDKARAEKSGKDKKAPAAPAEAKEKPTS
ncbi:thiol:disulfide interchange protein DsbA/DsbL [Parendozoicomonas haliclonae]|uniref:Thiol:disulfide interchange protein n=1 Tax=Parendozoicomonas haliclonae TaxID=1960125 RepID=A0A1X7AJA1_9GAMM|nr:thiol:disulfide interchange protein DsbA/DsbL [Parendozoicomonas haliclonae]SMA46220.1 Thiol:disulfide interchange protein DsbA precursor [Parendozoicomonas haliclonae]